MRLSRSWFLAITVFTGLGLVTGCGPDVPKSELGTILERVPDLPGMDEPYNKLRYVPPNAEIMQKGKPPIPSKTAKPPAKTAK